MIVNRATIRRQLNGDPPRPAFDGVDDDMRGSVLDDLEGEPVVDRTATPAGVGLPDTQTRKLSGRASPLSQQARTGRSSLLGDR